MNSLCRYSAWAPAASFLQISSPVGEMEGGIGVPRAVHMRLRKPCLKSLLVQKSMLYFADQVQCSSSEFTYKSLYVLD